MKKLHPKIKPDLEKRISELEVFIVSLAKAVDTLQTIKIEELRK